jgi:hypothetical protein
MNNQEKFIGICFDRKIAGKTYKEWLPIYEQILDKETYRQGNAADNLDNVVGLSTLYSRLNLWNFLKVRYTENTGNLFFKSLFEINDRI